MVIIRMARHHTGRRRRPIPTIRCVWAIPPDLRHIPTDFEPVLMVIVEVMDHLLLEPREDRLRALQDVSTIMMTLT